MNDKKSHAGIITTGAVIGLIAVVLVALGNPKTWASVLPASCATSQVQPSCTPQQ